METTGSGVSIQGALDATSIGATLNGVLSQNFATNTEVDNKFIADQAIPLINPFATPFTWNDIASQNFVNTRNFLTLDDVYPIGSIYFTASSVQPGTSLGGTWIRYAEGKCLFGVDSTDSDFSLEQTGGEKEHTLTKAEIPPHRHTESRRENGGFFNNGQAIVPILDTWEAGRTTINTGDGYADGLRGNAHNNLPPYIAIYIWKRTA
jgi:hypothetical protein